MELLFHAKLYQFNLNREIFHENLYPIWLFFNGLGNLLLAYFMKETCISVILVSLALTFFQCFTFLVISKLLKEVFCEIVWILVQEL
jgi:hypothetical protein